MKVEEFVSRAKGIAKFPTCYLMGGYGCRIGKDWYNENYKWNKQHESIIKAHSNTDPITFGFDCVCLVKSILWGFGGYPDKPYGGAQYASNNVPDCTIEYLAKHTTTSTDFDNIEVGELVFLNGYGHVGIYIGDGEVIESTPAWKCGVQKTLLPSRNTTNYDALPVRKWDFHGKCCFVEYGGVNYTQAYLKLQEKYADLEIRLNNSIKAQTALEEQIVRLREQINKAKEVLTSA